MDAKMFAVAFALVLLASCGSAQFYILDSHVIEIDVDAGGNALVIERYFMLFQNEQQLMDFRQRVSEIGASIEGWKVYDQRVFPHIGRENDVIVNGISFIESESSLDFLEISYTLTSPLMEKKRETTRVIDYSLKTRFFDEFIEGSLWVIPAGKTIIMVLPKGIEITKPVKPDAAVEGSTVVWTGYVFGNELSLNYSLFKDISSFDFGQAIRQLMQSDLFWILAAIALAASGVVLWKRKTIAERIENYLVEHTDFSTEEEE